MSVTSWTALDWVNVVLGLSVIVVLVGGIVTRYIVSKHGGSGGIGWQFIRYTVLAMSIPIVALLALNGKLADSATAALIGAAIGYAFSRAEEADRPKEK